jgi:cytochrome c553
MKTRVARQIGFLITIGLGLHLALANARAGEEGAEFFEKKIRPILVGNCYKCHSAKAEKLKGGLRLDSREGLLKGGETRASIVPGDPEKSLLIEAVRYSNEDLRMPPKKKLKDEEIADLTAWVRMGAPWPASGGAQAETSKTSVFNLQERARHWAFQPIKKAKPPVVRNNAWPRSPVDNFILAALEAQGLSPAPPADRRTLIRRVTYDLIGLPPTPTEIDAFLADESPDAYRKVVERLLASPHYGERWARHWLDLVRYAETRGHEFDFELPTAWQYRDYVIRALNADVPYDQYVTEHVAGDLLANPRRHPTEQFNESIIGTAFFFLGEAVHSPVDVREDECTRVDNQIDVLSKTFLGLTVGCARCHDHKFDAISARDYYGLAGYLISSRFQQAFVDAPERLAGHIQKLETTGAAARPLAIAGADRAMHVDVPRLRQWLKETPEAELKRVSHPLYLLAALGSTPPEKFVEAKQVLIGKLRGLVEQSQRIPDGATVFETFERRTYDNWFVTGDAFGTRATRGFETIIQADPAHPVRAVMPDGVACSGRISTRLQGALRSKSFVISKNKIWYRVAGRGATVNLILNGFQLIQDPIYGGLRFKLDGDQFRWHAQDVSQWKGHHAYIEILDDGDGYAAVDRIYFSDFDPPAEAPNSLFVGAVADSAVTSAEILEQRYAHRLNRILDDWIGGQGPHLWRARDTAQTINWLLERQPVAKSPELTAALASYREAEESTPTPTRVMAVADGTADDEYLLKRGNHKTPGEVVPRGFLEVLRGEEPIEMPNGSGRMQLAKHMTSAANPLVSRVMVNRIWQHHFGEGIVRSPDDYGVMGQPPTHPELLDFLASEFVRQGWSIKNMHRMILLSSTYQMSSQADAKAAAVDPQNKLLQHMPVRRLEAEVIRDAMLAVSGRLNSKMYGPSVPIYLTTFMNGRGRPAVSGPVDGDGRRSIYLSIRRNFLSPMFLCFDYPIPFTTIGRRSVSNVPAQALAMMNNPLVVEQARLWARNAMATPNLSAAMRIEGLYATAFARPPDEAEAGAALQFIKDQSEKYGHADDPRAWADLCHVLFNVKEFIFVN